MMTPEDAYRVIIINQSGKDLSPYIRDGLAHLIIDSYRNLGFAKACNTGMRLADTEYVGILNDDVEFMYPEWWNDMLAEFKALDTVACAINPWSPRNPRGGGGMADQYKYKDVLTEGAYTPEEIEEVKKIFSYARSPGACMWFTVFRRDRLVELGKHEGSPYGIALLDESFGQGSGEDYDMCRRFGIMGYQVYGSARVFAWHWWGNTKNNMPKEEVAEGDVAPNYNLIAKGYERMKEKWGDAREQQEPVLHPDGWDVNGRSGPKVPLNDEPIQTIMPL